MQVLPYNHATTTYYDLAESSTPGGQGEVRYF
jgi:hypothetical protein